MIASQCFTVWAMSLVLARGILRAIPHVHQQFITSSLCLSGVIKAQEGMGSLAYTLSHKR